MASEISEQRKTKVDLKGKAKFHKYMSANMDRRTETEKHEEIEKKEEKRSHDSRRKS